MAKNNPNRQELIQFINQLDKDLPKVQKLEEFSNGVHYLYLLHKIHPNVVKIGKVNVKAFHEHENINNLKLLALYLSQVKAPFTFQVPKVAARNYQQNLNLLKNLYKYYYSFQSKGPSLSKESKERSKSKVEPKKHEPKIVVKLPQKPNKPAQMKKYSPENSGLKGIAHDSQKYMQQIKKILVVVQEEKTPQQEAAQQKLERIKKILGIETPYSEQKNKKVNQTVNYSTKCSASKTNVKKDQQFDAQKTDLKTMTEDKTKMNTRNQNINGENKTDANKNVKTFDCQEIKQNVFSKYNGKSNRKSFNSRRITGNQRKQLFGFEQDDQKYNESLLSPVSGKQNEQKRRQTVQKSQNKNPLSQEKNKPVSLKKDIQKSANKANTEMKSHTNKKQVSLTNPESNIKPRNH